ncbi:hypothetical protein ACWDYH_31520 [Nocardia goodfellowii]
MQADLVGKTQDFGQAHAAAAQDAPERARSVVEALGLRYMLAHHEFIDVAREALDELFDVN